MKSKILLGAFFVIILLFISGCETKQKINFNIGYDHKGGFGYKETDDGMLISMLELVSSKENLEEICSEWNNSAFNVNNHNDELSNKIRSYDEKFFKDNDLIIYSFFTGNGTDTKIKSIVIDNTKLVINVKETKKRGAFNSLGFNWLMLIEVKKLDIPKTNALEINYK